jgi:integrase
MASIRQRGDKWQARVIRSGFPAEVKTFETRSDAQRWARSIEASIDRGAHQSATQANELLLRELLERYVLEVSPLKRGYSEEVIRIRALQRAKMSGYSIAKLTPGVVAAFRDERLRKVGAGAVIRDLSLVSAVVNHARREWGVTAPNPCELVRKPPTPPGRTRVLSMEEEVRLLAALAPTGRRNPWMLPLVQLALETAMRRGELLALEWRNIDLVRQTAYLPTSKSGKPRTVPLSLSAVAILDALPRTELGIVFPIEAQTMEAAFHRARVRADVPNLRFHDLRHTATSRMAHKLPNVIELASVTGHQTIQMLRRYYHPNPEILAQKLG